MIKSRLNKILTNEYFILSLITILALIVRLLNIDKPYGLWNDEILCYSIASKGLPFGIIRELMKTDFHMPLYYYYMGSWIQLFGSSDAILRLSSVFWGVLSIPAFFYLGKAFKSKDFGYFMAIIACLSPVMIYHAQELRFYSMLILFSAISITYFLKIIENTSLKNLLVFGLANLVILYIYSLGGLFICVEWLVLFLHMAFFKKENLANYLRYSALFFVFAIPYIILFLIYQETNNQQLISSFSWGGPPTFDIIPLINDWFSPFLTNIKDGVGLSRYHFYFKSLTSGFYLIFLMMPTFCFITGFIISLIKPDKKTYYILAVFSIVILTEILLWLSGEFHIVTRYTLIILPVILLLGANGIFCIKNKYIKNTLIALILVVFSYNAINYKKMDAFDMRYDGFKFPADTLMSLKPQDDYIISSRYSDEFFMKYLKGYKPIEIETNKMFTLDKTKQTALRVFDKKFVETTNKSNSKYKLAPYFISPSPTNELLWYMNSNIDKIPHGKKLIMIDGPYGDVKYEVGRDFTIGYMNNQIGEDLYKQIIFGIAVNKVRHDIKNILDNNKSLKLIKEIKTVANSREIYQKATWVFYIYQKV